MTPAPRPGAGRRARATATPRLAIRTDTSGRAKGRGGCANATGACLYNVLPLTEFSAKGDPESYGTIDEPARKKGDCYLFATLRSPQVELSTRATKRKGVQGQNTQRA